MDVRSKIAAWLEQNVGKKAAEGFLAWATDEQWTKVMNEGKKHASKFKEYAKTHEVKSRDDVYAYLRQTYSDGVADYVKNGLENGAFKEMAKSSKAKLA